MNTLHAKSSIESGRDALVLAGVGAAIGTAAALAIHLTVGLTRFVLFLAVG